MNLLSAVVDLQRGTFLITRAVFLRIFPNFSNTEVAFQWCSTKVFVQQKEVIRCRYCILVVKAMKNNLQ